MEQFDVAIIGGGILGVATARELLHQHQVSLCILEAEPTLAAHQSGRNSGVIHSGLYYPPGSYKARLCVEGRNALYEYCRFRNIPFRQCGKIVVATDEAEVARLDDLEQRGRANGLQGLERLDAAGVRAHEPRVHAMAGLFVPETGVVDFGAVTASLARDAAHAGAAFVTSARVQGVQRDHDQLIVEHARGTVGCRALINCAGVQADRIATMCQATDGSDATARPDVRIVPFRGEYYALERAVDDMVRSLIYPVPDPRLPFLGVHFTRMMDNTIEVGPNAVLALDRYGYGRWMGGIPGLPCGGFTLRDAWSTLGYAGFWRLARRQWRAGFGEVWRAMSKRAFTQAAQRMIPDLSAADIRWHRAGIRAQAVDRHGRLVNDFRFLTGDRTLHVLNAPSPAATACLSIARHIADTAAHAFGLARSRPTAASNSTQSQMVPFSQ